MVRIKDRKVGEYYITEPNLNGAAPLEIIELIEFIPALYSNAKFQLKNGKIVHLNWQNVCTIKSIKLLDLRTKILTNLLR